MWAAKRKFFIITTFLLIILAVAFYFYKTVIVKKPTCFDGLQNGIEEGVDCGGTCAEICKLRASDVNTLWAKTFEVSDGVSNVAALVENPNFDYNMSAVYNIKTFDAGGIRVNDFKQKITLKPGEKRLIFIPGVSTGKNKITKTFVKFTDINSLTIGKPEKIPLIVTSKIPIIEDGQTRLTIGIRNTGLTTRRDTEVVAILYTQEGEIIDIGKTFMEYIEKREDKKVNITWPKELDIENVRIDVFLKKINS